MRLLVFVCFLGCSLLMNAQVDYSKSDNDKGTSMMPILEKTNPIVKSIESKNLEIVRMEFDIVSEKKTTSWRTLYKGVKYGIMAYGDYRVKDLDISILKYEDAKWSRVIKDKKEDSYAIVYITPEKTREYKIEISVYEFHGNYKAAHYGLLITR